MGFIDSIARTLPTAAKVRTLLITVLVLTVPLLVYYIFYIKSQTDYFTNRNFRALARVSTQITTRVESLSVVLKSTGAKFVKPDEFVEQASSRKKQESPRFIPGAKNSEKNLAGLKGILKNLKGYGAEIVPVEVRSANERGIGDDQALASNVTLEVRPEDGVMWLYFNLQYAAADGGNSVTIRTKTDFDQLIAPITGGYGTEGARGLDHEEGFDNLLVAESGDGRVIFQQSASELRLVSLDKLSSAGDEGKTIDLNALGRVSSVADVKLAGSDYKLFLHPADLSIPQSNAADGHSLRWTVCGLVPVSRFRREVLAISYSLLIVLAFLTALSILSWPFLKLLLIGPKDRLRTADVYFLFFSTLIGLALLTFLGLYAYSYRKIEHVMDRQLEGLAGDIQKNFQSEVKASLAQLDALNAHATLNADLSRLDDPAAAGPEEQAASRLKRIYRQSVLATDETRGAHPYPYFDTAVWIDEQGRQRLKWTVEDYQPQFIDVSGRPYFSNLKQGRYRYLGDREFLYPEWCAAPSRPQCYVGGRGFWLEPIISKTTGRNEVEISEWKPEAVEGGLQPPQAAGRPQPAHTRWISAFDTRLLSLMQPVLPTGFGFCVLDDEGRTLFHSDEIHHLGENFFQEADDNRALRSAVIDRRKAALDVSYLGRGHRVFTTPIDNFPNWTLVVYRDKQVLRTAFLELLTLSSLLFLGYCLLALTCLSAFYLLNLNANARRAWLWPAGRRTLSYYVSVLVLAPLSIISALAYSGRGIRSVLLVCLISFLGSCFFFLNLRFVNYGRDRKGLKESGFWYRTAGVRRGLYRYDLGYVLNIVLLFLLVAIIPAAAFFKFAYESEIGLFIKHGQITVAKGLVEREERIRSQFGGVWGEGDKATRDAFTRDRLARDWDVYDAFFFKTSHGTVGSLGGGARETAGGRPRREAGGFFSYPAADLVSYLSEFTPLYNRTSIERLGLGRDAFADRSYEWLGDASTEAVLRINGSGPNNLGSPWQYLATRIPTLGWPGPLWWLAFLSAGVPFYLWVRFTVRKIFLLNIHKPTSYNFRELPAEVGYNRFIVLEPPYTQREMFDGGQLHRVNLRELSASPGWAEAFDYEALLAAAVEKVIALDYFEHGAGDPEANRQKVSFLEKLLSRRRTLFIISTIEPSRYHFAGDDGGAAAAGSNGLSPSEYVGRWSSVVSHFFTVYVEDEGMPEWFAGEVEKYREQLLQGEADDGKRRAVEVLIQTLKEECARKSPLQNIGLEIIRQPNFVRLTREHLIGRIRIQAGTYYQDIWDSCSSDEKLSLFHLAQDRLLSPNDPDIGQLLRKGLVVRDPDLHLMNESFRQFVKSEALAPVIAEFEREARKSSLWHVMKAPLLVVLISVVIFLFTTQRDLYTSSLAIMTAITTAIPAFFKVLSLFQKEQMNLPVQQ